MLHYTGLWDTDELYDLQEALLEIKNLIREEEHQGIVRQINKELYEQLKNSGDMCIPPNPDNRKQSILRNKSGSPAVSFHLYLYKIKN